MTSLPTLYHKTKLGKFVEWKIRTHGDKIIVEYGEVGGKKQTAINIAEPKNVGKANETTGSQQAQLEAAAMHKHRLDRKYSLSMEEAQDMVFLPMLAHPWEKYKHKMQFPAHVQPKLDGLRAMAYWEGDEVILMSRGGKTWNLPHLSTALAKVLPHHMVLDGEIYKHQTNLQAINKLAKKFREGPDGTESLQFCMFDCIDLDAEKIWLQRHQDLEAIGHAAQGLHQLRYVHTQPAESEEEIMAIAAEMIGMGYEGAIVRSLDGIYQFGHRSHNLLKVKFFQDSEFKIVGHYMGTGKHDGCVGFVCEQPNGKTFKCYPKGTLEERRAYNHHVEQYYGQLLKVKYQFLTDDGTPFLPVGLCIREPKDM